MESRPLRREPELLAELVDYATGSVVSRTLMKNQGGNVTLFSFDAGQGLSEHSTPYDALVIVLDGQGEFVVGGRKMQAEAGQALIMPAGIPHAVHAVSRFKMLLVMVKGS